MSEELYTQCLDQGILYLTDNGFSLDAQYMRAELSVLKNMILKLQKENDKLRTDIIDAEEFGYNFAKESMPTYAEAKAEQEKTK